MNKLFYILLILGCYNTNSGVLIQDDKSYLTFNCNDIEEFEVEVGESTSFTVDARYQCDQLFQIPTGRNKITITKNGKVILYRDIFLGSGETYKLEIK